MEFQLQEKNAEREGEDVIFKNICSLHALDECLILRLHQFGNLCGQIIMVTRSMKREVLITVLYILN